jgi:hypothetical protein
MGKEDLGLQEIIESKIFLIRGKKVIRNISQIVISSKIKHAPVN